MELGINYIQLSLAGTSQIQFQVLENLKLSNLTENK